MPKKKSILFYCATTPAVMIYKMARVLRKNGYKTTLFTMCEKDLFDWNFYFEAFDKIICSDFQFFKPGFKTIPYIFKHGGSFLKFLIKMKFIRPYLVIGISGNNWQLKLAHKYFFKKIPFIYFPYDIISHFYSSFDDALKRGPPRFELEAERYSFENAEGIIHKGSPEEIKAIRDRVHKRINIVALDLSFLPYCSKEFRVPINKNKLSKKDNELHIVYIGGFPNTPQLIKKVHQNFSRFNKEKIHMHAYVLMDHLPKKEEDQVIGDFFDGLKNPFFHLHKPVGAFDIIKEISKYDFGYINAHEKNEDSIEPKFTVGNKIASYFEAGIPFIYEKDLEYIDKIMKKYGMPFAFDTDNISPIVKSITALDYEKIVTFNLHGAY